jgi:hypothetical protein
MRPALNKIVYYFYFPFASTTPIAAGGLSSGSVQFRYVIIPGAVAGGRSSNRGEKVAELKGQLYSESQLKNMSYAQVCSLLNIAQ